MRFLLVILAILSLLRGEALGLIVYGDNGNATYTSPPVNGAPWSNVAQQQRSGAITIDSGAVYIGNGYLLTANHANAPLAVILDGVAYSVDPSFPAISFTPVDLRLYKIVNPPALPMIPLPDSTETDTNTSSTLIGWGKGKGAQINTGLPNFYRGWQWGGTLLDDDTKTKRWGTNTTTSSVETIAYWNTYSYAALRMDFNASLSSEATAAMSDSGGGVFQLLGTTWKLSGILTVAPYDSTTYPNGNSLYNPSYQTYAVQLKPLASKFRYRQWKQEKGIAEAADPKTDSDGDGFGILEEYAFGMDPSVASNTGAPTIEVEGTDLTCTYRLERTRTDLSVRIEESTDLSTWISANVTSTSTISDNGTLRTMKAKVPLAGADKKFLRLSLTALTN